MASRYLSRLLEITYSHADGSSDQCLDMASRVEGALGAPAWKGEALVPLEKPAKRRQTGIPVMRPRKRLSAPIGVRL